MESRERGNVIAWFMLEELLPRCSDGYQLPGWGGRIQPLCCGGENRATRKGCLVVTLDACQVIRCRYVLAIYLGRDALTITVERQKNKQAGKRMVRWLVDNNRLIKTNTGHRDGDRSQGASKETLTGLTSGFSASITGLPGSSRLYLQDLI